MYIHDYVIGASLSEPHLVRSMAGSAMFVYIIGASLSEPHTYAKHGDFVCLYSASCNKSY